MTYHLAQEFGGRIGNEGPFEAVFLPELTFILTQDYRIFGDAAPDWIAVSRSKGTPDLEADAVLLVEIQVNYTLPYRGRTRSRVNRCNICKTTGRYALVLELSSKL